MTEATIDSFPLPRIRDGLTIQAISPIEYVVKRSDSREYFSIGPQEAFLLGLLDGLHSTSEIQRRYAAQFNDELTLSDLIEFVDAIRPMGLLRPSAKTQSTEKATGSIVTERIKTLKGGQSLLFFRIPLCNPDRFLSRLVQWIPFVWTRTGLCALGCLLAAAFCVMVSSGNEMVSAFPDSPGWTDAIQFLAVMLVCTALHEVAHGATLKHYGGEVHDSGLLFMFFTPCLYCNVSDAWLIPQKSKRLAITAAGGLCDLFLWAIGVFIWRMTVIGTGVNHAALLVLTICGGRSLLNFNPLLRLDGYYLLSDWLSIPNLRPRAMDYWMGHVRWLLWGAARPPSQPRGRTLLAYGLLCWLFAIVFLDLIFLQFFQYMGGQFGVTGLIFVLLLLLFASRRVFKGFLTSEFGTMLKQRTGRKLIWSGGICAAAILLFAIPVKRTSNGSFEVRPGNIVQLHVPVSGIVDRVVVEDGQRVSEGDLIAELRSPALEADILKTRDMLREVEANLKRLTSGTRPEEVRAQQDRVKRLDAWHQLGLEELAQEQIAHEQQLLIQEHRIRQQTAELNNSRENLAHSERLYLQGALAGAQLRSDRLQILQLESQLAQMEAAFGAARATGIRSKQAEISRRSQELEDARDRLGILEAGSRPEDIAAETAKHERIVHELAYLETQKSKLQIRASVAGIFSAPRLRERIGQVAPQDSVFCTIENPDTSRVEISVTEDDAAHLRAGQPVALKVRAIPFETFDAVVEGISSTASKTAVAGQNVVVVRCQINNPDGRLKSGMTGFGRVHRGWNPIGVTLVTQGMKYLRTEFWW